MIRSRLFAFASAAALALAGCTQGEVAAPPKVETADDGRPNYNVYFDAGQFAPFIMYDAENQPTGFDHDIIQAIAEKQGFRLTFTPHYWTGIFANLGHGADIVSAGVTITEERKQQMDFSDPYFENFPALLVHSGSPIQTLSDVQDKKIAVVQGNLTEQTLQNYQRGTGEAVPYRTTWESVRSVIRKETDGAFNDIGPLTYYAQQYKDQNLEIVIDSNAAKEYYGFAVAKGNTDLVNKINEGLKQIRQDGTYDRIHAKWFSSNLNQAAPAAASQPAASAPR